MPLLQTAFEVHLPWDAIVDNVLHVQATFATCPSSKRQTCTQSLQLRASGSGTGPVPVCDTLGMGSSWWRMSFLHDPAQGSLVVSRCCQCLHCSRFESSIAPILAPSR
jgi:hypothetical protein